MSCSNCSSPKEPLPEEVFGLTFNASHVEDEFGRRYVYDQVFIKAPHKPKDGWYVRVRLKKQWHIVTAKIPGQVIRELARLLSLNAISPDSKVLWACCNVQWLKRTHSRNHTVDFARFSSYISPENPL
jgi:hypothetical protein